MFDIDKFIDDKQKELIPLRAQAERLVSLYTRIKHLGLSCQLPEISAYHIHYGMCLDITRDDLPTLRAAFGKTEIIGKSVKDKAAGLIWVQIGLLEQPDAGIWFRYERQLSEEAKCKIVTEYAPHDSLVCEINPESI